jgi:hypothetical protein
MNVNLPQWIISKSEKTHGFTRILEGGEQPTVLLKRQTGIEPVSCDTERIKR